MVKFLYNVCDESLLITKENNGEKTTVDDCCVIGRKGFEFRLQKFAEEYMDSHDLYNEEYQIFIRIH